MDGQVLGGDRGAGVGDRGEGRGGVAVDGRGVRVHGGVGARWGSTQQSS